MKLITLRVLLLSLAVGVLVSAQPSPQTLSTTELKASVTVRRDARSIPYIEAKSDADLYFAQGYVTASDRLWQMDVLRRVARGEMSEIFGDRRLEEDKRWRRFGFASIAEQSLSGLTPGLRNALENYARGVNAYIASLDETTMPLEFKVLQYAPRKWSPTDTIVIGRILADALSTTWHHDVLRSSLQNLQKDKLADLTNLVTPYDVVLFGSDPPASAGGRVVGWHAINSHRATATSWPPAHASGSASLPTAKMDDEMRTVSLNRVGLYAEDLAASNNWVISGKRTADGKPLLANDPHLSPSTPGIWYLTHLSTPTMRVSGVTFPGVPGIVLGHNEHIAWGATNVGPDVQDLYYETFNEAGEYKTPDGWQKPLVRREVINVRSNPLRSETKPVAFDVTVTRNGPVILEEGGKRYALKWTALDPQSNEFESFFLTNRAKNWNEFKSALKKYGGATQNFVYADVNGNIGWYAAGRIPIRRTGDGALPYDGAKRDGDWTGMIPFAELPHLYNPASGLIVTANQRIVGTSYKYSQMSRDASAPWRARRIVDLLNAKTKITMDDVRDVQHDVYNIPLANLAKEIAGRNSASPQTIEILKTWDGQMLAESHAAMRINDIRICLANRIADANPGVPGYLIRERILDGIISQNTARWLPPNYTNYDALIKNCDSDVNAMYTNAKLYGQNNRPLWGSAWKSKFPHPLAAAPLIGGLFATPEIPINGSAQSPNVGSHVSMRHITTPGNWDATRHVIPLGQSGDPKSPHYKDQFEKWRTGEAAVFPFTKQAVEKASVKALVFVPK